MRETLHDAAMQGDLATLKRLLEEGVSVNATDEVIAAPCSRSLPSALAPPRS